MKDKLLEAMRQLALRRFDTRLTADDSAEGRELAAGFNKLSENLESQFAALTALAEIDRLIFEAPGLERILDVLLIQVRRITRCDAVAIMLVDADDPEQARLNMSLGTGALDAPPHRIERVALPGNFSSWTKPLKPDEVAERLRRPCEASLTRHGLNHVATLPVTGRGGVAAMLALGLREAQALSAEQQEFARAIADRLSVALAGIEREQGLRQQAYYDNLTGLPNRQLFKDRLERELTRAGRAQEKLGLLFIDLDRFKHINDTQGHGAGDELLRVVAARLREAVKETDTVARLGGDEFAVILPQLANADAVALVVERIFGELSRPVMVSKQAHSPGASIGVALYPQDGQMAEELLRNADTAMYRAKKEGRGRVMFFEACMNMRAAQRMHLETGLHRALGNQQFELYLQPQYELQGGALSGAEALIRWHNPKRGLHGADEFLPVAQESNLILEIGEWALQEACRQYSGWRQQGIAPPRLAVNISAEQLRQYTFPDVVRNALLSADIPPWALEIEFTEMQLLAEPERVGGVLKSLAELGVRLVLDDFGTGMSSIGLLYRHRIDCVKIDPSFVAGLENDPAAAAMVGALVPMAHSLGKQIVAEGVETRGQYERLRNLGCDFAQGYFFARPMTSDDFLHFLRARHDAAEQLSPGQRRTGRGVA